MHTHTHTHTHRQIDRQAEREREIERDTPYPVHRRRQFHGVYDVIVLVEVMLLLGAVVVAAVGRAGCGGGKPCVCVERRSWTRPGALH